MKQFWLIYDLVKAEENTTISHIFSKQFLNKNQKI